MEYPTELPGEKQLAPTECHRAGMGRVQRWDFARSHRAQDRRKSDVMLKTAAVV